MKEAKILKLYSTIHTKSYRGTWNTQPNWEKLKQSYQPTC